MARTKKRGEAGATKNYMTRNQALRKLQISLADFRKLCIWKGIYPREPRRRQTVLKSATSSTTFYYHKDIQYLAHEPLLCRFREQKVLEKRISRALGRGDVANARRLDRDAARPEVTGRPRYTLDQVVRERYPTFVDALRDLDDCLSMLFLFANLPATEAVPARVVARCSQLCLEFQHYVIASRSLRKSFLSIKGIYYQVTIQGEEILWLVPYRFNQRIVADVDFRIMATFVEFYLTMLGFVNFRLYTSLGLRYPPRLDLAKDDAAAELAALTIEGKSVVTEGQETTDQQRQLAGPMGPAPDPQVQAAVDMLLSEIKQSPEGNPRDQIHDDQRPDVSESTVTDVLDKFEPAALGGDVLPQPVEASSEAFNIFAGCTIFLSRETPRQPLEFLLRAFGCRRIGWDAVLGEGAFTTNELDTSITHQIVDRPLPPATEDARVPGRVYVQPQWVWDSVNEGELCRVQPYAPGAQLPPHMSPFVSTVHGHYDPTMPLEAQQLAEEESESEVETEDILGRKVATKPGQHAESDIGTEDDENEEQDEQDEGASEFGGLSEDEQEQVAPAEEEEDDPARQRQHELEAELEGFAVQAIGSSKTLSARELAKREQARRARDEAEEVERAKGMLSKKKRRLYDQMMYTNNKRSEEDRKLKAKRRRIEKRTGERDSSTAAK